ncbi:MAG: FAD-dependent oxidoreductase [Gammaproteobacteria bacterium]
MTNNLDSGYDVVIIGAGLAGATAGECLSACGLNTITVEARGRAGGRGFTRAFANDAEPMEFGGAWITPWQHRIRGLCKKHRIELRPRHPVVARRWFRDGALHDDWPIAAAEYSAHEHALALMSAHSALIKAGITRDHHGRCFGDISFNDYLDMIDAPEATRQLISAWWAVSGNGDKARVPATEILHSVGYFDGTPDGMCEVWTDTLVGGVQALTTRMIAAGGALCRFGAAATRVSQDADGVRVTLNDGSIIAARAAIVATGLNPMAAIAFDPSLSIAKSAGRKAGNLGRAVKVWAKVEGVPVGTLVTGGGTGIEWMFSERLAADGTAFVVGFGVAANGWEPQIPKDVELAVQRFFPEGRFLDCDWHDWNNDPFSRGTWVAAMLGQPQAHAAFTWSMANRLAFASSDFAAAEAGWFEGAIISGETAAAEIRSALAKV